MYAEGLRHKLYAFVFAVIFRLSLCSNFLRLFFEFSENHFSFHLLCMPCVWARASCIRADGGITALTWYIAYFYTAPSVCDVEMPNENLETSISPVPNWFRINRSDVEWKWRKRNQLRKANPKNSGSTKVYNCLTTERKRMSEWESTYLILVVYWTTATNTISPIWMLNG